MAQMIECVVCAQGVQGMPMPGMQMQGMRPMMPGGQAVPGGGVVAPGANPAMMGGGAPVQQQPQPQGNAVQLDPFGAL